MTFKILLIALLIGLCERYGKKYAEKFKLGGYRVGFIFGLIVGWAVMSYFYY